MGTRGYRIIKFRGRYWIFYNHWDSYPEGMGNSLVEGIPIDQEEYQKWLESQRALFAKWDSLLQRLLCITPEDLSKLESDESCVGLWQAAFDERMENGPPTYYPGSTDMNIEYTYTIDLDLEVFSVDNAAHYRLNHIPRNGEWIEAMFQDGAGRRFVLPQYVPKESLASLTLEAERPIPNANKYLDDVKTRKVEPKKFNSTSSKLRCKLFNIFQRSQHDPLSVTLLGWTPQDLPFREIAYFILCLAAGGDHFALVDERRVIKPLKSAYESDHSYAAIVAGSQPEGERELISSVGAGYHMQGFPMGSAPNDSMYWFKGALVCLVPRLNRPGVLEKAVADAIRYGRLDCTCTSFHALLMSIEDVVLIKSFHDGSVEHTELLPLLSFDGHLSMDAWERYNDIDKFYDNEVAKGQQVKPEDSKDSNGSGGGQVKANDQEGSHSQMVEDSAVEGEKTEESEEPQDQAKEEHAERGDQLQGDKVRSDGQEQEQSLIPEEEGVGREEGNEVGKEAEEVGEGGNNQEVKNEGSKSAEHSENNGDGHNNGPVWTVEDTFMSLVQFFEAIIHESLKPTDSADGGLPNEICGMILGNVTDTATFGACMKVSRRFRSLCHQRPLIMDDLVFLEPLVDHPTSGKDLEDPKKAHWKPDFRVVECSSSRLINVRICSGLSRNASLACRMVTGSERHRKSFAADCPIAILGLDISAPWDEEEQPSYRRSRRWLQRTEHEPTDTLWDSVLQEEPITTESSIQDLLRFWTLAVKSVYKDIEGAKCRDESSEAWKLPPNTRQLCASCDLYKYEDFFHYLFVRVKRASKYWDTLWEDIIREAAENLSAPDKCFELKRLKRSGKQVLGADEPYVMLVVGLEVRLFKWEQGFPESVPAEWRKGESQFSRLKELQPGKVYLVTNGEDQKDIASFLKTATEKLQVTKKKETPGYPASDGEE